MKAILHPPGEPDQVFEIGKDDIVNIFPSLGSLTILYADGGQKTFKDVDFNIHLHPIHKS